MALRHRDYLLFIIQQPLSFQRFVMLCYVCKGI
jgi:hypothetical protein